MKTIALTVAALLLACGGTPDASPALIELWPPARAAADACAPEPRRCSGWTETTAYCHYVCPSVPATTARGCELDSCSGEGNGNNAAELYGPEFTQYCVFACPRSVTEERPLAL